MNPLKYFFLIACFWVATVTAQTQTEKIDALVQSYAKLGRFNGNVAVARKGHIVFARSYGLADREFDIPNTQDTRFRIASLTKQFTAVLILQLAESGQLDLHAPITRYLPYYKKELAEKITIHHLLTHTAGLPDYTERDDFFTEISKRQYDHREFIQKFCSDTLLHEPGTQYKYSNAGYYLLGGIIEEVTHDTYANVLQKKILDVLHMQNTGMETPERLIKNRAKGYNYGPSGYSNAEYIDISSTIFSAGAMYSTTGDLLKWDKALFSNKLLSAKSTEMMFTPFSSNYGYGVGTIKSFVPDLKTEVHFVFHQGAINGFRSVMTHVVNEDLVILLLCNTFEADPNPVSNGIFALLHGLPYSFAGEEK
ncbi:beta-lactamase family protein [Flavobacterium sp. MAH-1]|uniref:Beta-lactamase family protein n=1 Tax=Flavobacterium agri TaxID=2743471 RepID=A0A7Y8Y153_9FLAO|nr:serine hydrolase domain-containing protein [Flavobacterium agri]NUY80485.1 beta-lactamase family protein [Flavobacterium agri]NYA70510.1 beta-lactamase family protein [Flavobacterium agri]